MFEAPYRTGGASRSRFPPFLLTGELATGQQGPCWCALLWECVVLCCWDCLFEAVRRTCLFSALKAGEKQRGPLLIPGWHGVFQEQKVRKSWQQPWRKAHRGCGLGRETYCKGQSRVMAAPDMACEALLASGITVSVNTNLKTLHTHTKVSKTFPVNWEGGTLPAEREDKPSRRQVIPSKSPLKSISEGCNETPASCLPSSSLVRLHTARWYFQRAL